MTAAPQSVLRAECRRFVVHLCGSEPPDRLVDLYVEAHHGPRHAAALRPDGFDRRLLDMARRSALGTMAADAWAARFRPRSVVRKKLVLALALLECTPPHCDALDVPCSRGPAGAVLRGAWIAVTHAACLVLGAVLLAWPCRSAAEAAEPES